MAERKKAKTSDELFNQILEEMDYDPLSVEIEVAKIAKELGDNAEKLSEKLLCYNLVSKMNKGMNNKIYADRKAVDIELSGDDMVMPQIVLNGISDGDEEEDTTVH